MIRRLTRLALVATAATLAAYQAPRPWLLPAATSRASDAVFESFYPAEGDVRWSAGRSVLRFPDPGLGAWRVEVDLAPWRFRGLEAPVVRLVGDGGAATVRAERAGATGMVDALARGLWRSDIVVGIESPTFSPGRQDPRRLGVQVRAVRLVPVGSALRLPPLRAVAFTVMATLLAFALCLTAPGLAPRADVLAALVALLASAARRVAPVETADALPLVSTILGLCVLLSLVLPRPTRALRESVGGAGNAIRDAVAGLWRPRPAALALAGLLALVGAHRARPVVVFDLGSDRTNWLARDFGPFDSDDAGRFRTARGAVLDLRDFASSGAVQIAVTAAAAGGAEPAEVARAGSLSATLPADGQWHTTSGSTRVGNGWRPGPLVQLGPGAQAVRVRAVTLDRSGTWPTLRTAFLLLLSGALGFVILGSAGAEERSRAATFALLLLAQGVGLWLDPGVVTPFLPMLASLLALTAALTALLVGVERVRRHRSPDPVVVAAAAAGFAGWLTATTFPLYRGGHFLFHSAIAEEIWKGRFLIYYLPYPGSMLSQQAQWGNVIVPHPCLYQVLVAPLAALPTGAFLLAEKIVLAGWLASLVFVAAFLAGRLSGPPAARWSAATFALLVPTYQLLGLGHLMTILGVWASSLALCYLVARLPRLREPGVWWRCVVLLVLCFLSYFAALLFTGLVLVLYLLWLVRRERPRAAPLFSALVVATALSFGLYYAYWFWPFLSESLPALASGKGAVAEEHHRYLLGRLLSQPGKLDYSYGSLFVPVAAFAGLLAMRKAAPRERWLLALWLAILPIVSGMDLFFNFLLKHHYYVMVPVAVGVGSLFAAVSRLGRFGRVVALALFAILAMLGLDTALQVALGLIP